MKHGVFQVLFSLKASFCLCLIYSLVVSLIALKAKQHASINISTNNSSWTDIKLPSELDLRLVDPNMEMRAGAEGSDLTSLVGRSISSPLPLEV